LMCNLKHTITLKIVISSEQNFPVVGPRVQNSWWITTTLCVEWNSQM